MEAASIIAFGRLSGEMLDDYTDVLRELRAILKHEFLVVDENGLNEDASLRSQFGLDSIAFLELRAICEKRFEISVTDQDFSKSNFGSLRELAQLVIRLRFQRHDC